MYHSLKIKECYETKLTVSQEKYVRELQKTDIKYITKAQDKKKKKKNLSFFSILSCKTQISYLLKSVLQ